ncbi:MAG: DegT/DnrJ/EryC1/StrS family aminotransferase, partial [Thermoplasmatales archaeon]|nr:DegT/DnrJ/EryC1/StrS family aminotransferase [Thermoplasmatales archaeon]
MNDNSYIPVNDIKLTRKEIDYAIDAISSGFISGTSGEYIEKFEKEFAKFCGTRFAVACSSGTTALQLAVRASGIKKGDEVLVNTFTNIASILAIIYNGAKPVLVDSRKDTWSMDENELESKITKRTKAVIPVHIFGHPVKMDTVMDLANKYNLIVIEDAAEAHGAEFLGKKVGGIGHMGCFSFLAGKIITSGEGGMVVTNQESLAEKMRSLRSLAFGSDVNRYMHVDLGYNFRMTNIQAAIGYGQAQRAMELVNKRRLIASWYNEKLKNIKGITLPVEAKWAKNVYWMYGILINDEFEMTRNNFIHELRKHGIDSRP